jgi:hypothetical protein
MKAPSSDLLNGLLAMLAIGFVAAVSLSGDKFKTSTPPVEGAAGIGSRAGPLADQLSLRGGTVAYRALARPPNASR